ncbi:nicotinate-nucleotide adenylyltransferase [Geitlerinema sp. PCC 9228]|jgi:nicotinate-nucleotide adenylyltransferase|uniref:nicotinate-nucleotide adenylyltransferase n=1 Tax=Geitlerinema sp. PCC 9228 TaxID=111611 RepID=UPI0008F9D6E2|nr:nicotinate-nucleotide adenylyltransferase [Geitlerinema sp. PCC 9228]
MEDRTTKIALFGTSADPPSIAHREILHQLAANFDWVAVWASDNPFKSHQTPLERRATMLQLVIHDVMRHQPNAQGNIGYHPELSSSRALLTVERAEQIWPNADFTFVVGSDLLEQLPRWYRVEEFLQKVQLLVVPRAGYPIKEKEVETLKQMGARLAIAHMEIPDTSSTAYRQIKDPNAVPQPIAEYIHRERLYEPC